VCVDFILEVLGRENQFSASSLLAAVYIIYIYRYIYIYIASSEVLMPSIVKITSCIIFGCHNAINIDRKVNAALHGHKEGAGI